MPPVKTRTAQGTDEKVRVSSGVGTRIREARRRSAMTQQQVAGDRYTKAYISALENGLVRPSVAALEYLATRLGTTPSALLADVRPAWSRIDADLQLAAGKWQVAADGYDALLADPDALDKGTRAELLRGRAEAFVRLDHVSEAAADASQAIELFESVGRHEDAALASYWLSAAMYEQGNTDDAKALLQAILARVRTGMRIAPDFRLRLLMALAANETRDANHAGALSYLEQIRGLVDELDDRRRAHYLFDLAYVYTETGDYEAAIRTGHASLALFKAVETSFDFARLEYELALAHLHTGNIARAQEMASDSVARFLALGDDRQLAHALDSRAQIEIALGEYDKALETADETLRLATATDNPYANADAKLTMARAYAGLAATKDGARYVEQAKAAFAAAADESRTQNRMRVVRRVLAEWADFVAGQGDHKAAFELSREALAASR